MNVQLHHVISDLAGATGLAIVDAILASQRDPAKLAELRDWRIRASKETIMKSLVGDYREEHISPCGNLSNPIGTTKTRTRRWMRE